MIESYEYTYLCTNRVLLLHKLYCLKKEDFFFFLPKIKGLMLFFSVDSIENLNDESIFNYYYFFQFFFGSTSHYRTNVAEYTFGKLNYSFNIQCYLNKDFCFESIYFIMNDVLSVLDRDTYFFINNVINDLEHETLIIRDLNIFREKKTNFGLFFLKKPLNIKFFFLDSNNYSRIFLLNSLKLLKI